MKNFENKHFFLPQCYFLDGIYKRYPFSKSGYIYSMFQVCAIMLNINENFLILIFITKLTFTELN